MTGKQKRTPKRPFYLVIFAYASLSSFLGAVTLLRTITERMITPITMKIPNIPAPINFRFFTKFIGSKVTPLSAVTVLSSSAVPSSTMSSLCSTESIMLSAGASSTCSSSAAKTERERTERARSRVKSRQTNLVNFFV